MESSTKIVVAVVVIVVCIIICVIYLPAIKFGYRYARDAIKAHHAEMHTKFDIVK